MRIEGRVAVVTGASSGIGAELARQLAAAGLAVGLTARRTEPMEALASEVRSRGGTAAVATADAADVPATRQAIARLADALGPVDLLVANAGMVLETSAASFSATAVEKMLRVNVVGAAAAIEAVLPGMLERGRGHLVGISSLAGSRGLPGISGYSASKAALSTLLEGLRIDLRGRGVAVTAVHPGYVRTPMIEGTEHRRPFVVPVDRAARRILRGIAARRRVVNFPAPMAAAVALGRWLPGPLYEAAARRLLAEK